jgi:threonine synthase
MMDFLSTRDPQHRVSLSVAMLRGLAPDGGLYVPERWPPIDRKALGAAPSLAAQASGLLAPLASGDPLAAQLPAICAEAFDFPAPLRALTPEHRLSALELFHGPTAAFKDFGARFLAAALSRLRTSGQRPLKILVATSGDTGGAVAAAFHGRPGIEVAVLFPKGLVSPLQQQQLTCWGDNVQSLAVRGTFDDCQRLVKEAFVDDGTRARFELSSANSINVGRLLPQAAYYVAASLEVWRHTGEPASFIIPSGNLGNATACVWARLFGAPIGQIVLAHNANRTVPDYLHDGILRVRPSVATLASAMDVGNPSNLERLSALYPDAATLRGAVSAVSVSDAQIRARISADYRHYGVIWCPHTATAAEVYAGLEPQRRERGHWVVVATAHPAKFSEIVQPLIDAPLPMPENLARLYARASKYTEIEPNLAALRRELSGVSA